MSKTLSDVAHEWAHQLSDGAGTYSRSLYFTDRTIYSYGSHFPIATIVENNCGQRAVLFTEDSYSNTTAKHITAVRSACSHLFRIYIPEVEPFGCVHHEKTFALWIKQCQEIKAKFRKARLPYKYYEEIESVLDKASIYATFFRIKVPTKLSNILSEFSPEYVEEIRRKSEEWNSKREERIEQKRKTLMEKRQRNAQEKLSAWLAGENIWNLGYELDYQRLRIKNDRIETTKGVKIPMELAKRFYQGLKDKVISVGDRILNYRIDSINGNIINIGCHKFELDYLLEFGSRL